MRVNGFSLEFLADNNAKNIFVLGHGLFCMYEVDHLPAKEKWLTGSSAQRRKLAQFGVGENTIHARKRWVRLSPAVVLAQGAVYMVTLGQRQHCQYSFTADAGIAELVWIRGRWSRGVQPRSAPRNRGA